MRRKEETFVFSEGLDYQTESSPIWFFYNSNGHLEIGYEPSWKDVVESIRLALDNAVTE